MLIYLVLNTMIWAVVFLSRGKVLPANYHEKEVYNWGRGKQSMPKWMRGLIQKITGTNRVSRFMNRKDVVELVETDSAKRTSSHNDPAQAAKDEEVPRRSASPKEFVHPVQTARSRTP
jgi:adenine/guanine/hypoxanthine permease